MITRPEAMPPTAKGAIKTTVDAVIIGRNEGERLRRCLESCALSEGGVDRVIYVDSGSTDGSVALARAMGAEVVQLDMSRPFTAARARNAGLARSAGEFVQFVDGDCEIRPGWVEHAAAELSAHPETAVVFGRLHERFPERSVYNRLSDLEWATLVGEAPFCGGIAMMRAAALRAVDGFDESIVAGEEPELCARLRARGGVVRGLDADMCLHDADMTRFSQWWRRQTRSGYGMAEVTLRLWRSGQRYFVRPLFSALCWGLCWPIALALSLALAAFGGAPWWVAGVVVLVFPLMTAKVAAGGRRRGLSPRESLAYGALTMLSKFAIAQGAIRSMLGPRHAAARSGAFQKDRAADPAPRPAAAGAGDRA